VKTFSWESWSLGQKKKELRKFLHWTDFHSCVRLLFWEGHKNLELSPIWFDVYLATIKWVITPNFVAFSEKLNFTKDPITKIASHKYFILYQPPLKIIETFTNSSLVTLVPRIHRIKDSFIPTTTDTQWEIFFKNPIWAVEYLRSSHHASIVRDS
jgi:hypothetical protein